MASLPKYATCETDGSLSCRTVRIYVQSDCQGGFLVDFVNSLSPTRLVLAGRLTRHSVAFWINLIVTITKACFKMVAHKVLSVWKLIKTLMLWWRTFRCDLHQFSEHFAFHCLFIFHSQNDMNLPMHKMIDLVLPLLHFFLNSCCYAWK
jgi:hypothetical protein